MELTPRQQAYVKRVGNFLNREGLETLTTQPILNEETGEPLLDAHGEYQYGEPYFSWSCCDCCGSPLGGDREDMNGYNPTTKEIQSDYQACTDCILFLANGDIPDDENLEWIELSREYKDLPWFDGPIMVKTIPDNAIRDCNHAGERYYDCAYWMKELNFSCPQDLGREYLARTGGWLREKISEMSDEEVSLKVFWLACGDIRDHGEFYLGI